MDRRTTILPTEDPSDFVAEVHDFIDKNEQKYIQLISSVKRYLEDVILSSADLRDTICRIYSRKDCQESNTEIKNINRLISKLTRFKQKSPKDWSNGHPIHIHDIVACRIVVYYRHQINLIFQKIVSTMPERGFIIEYEEYRNKLGYHAHHIVVSSKKNHLRNLLCEIQIKTVLHDAWGSKTHGFIYKPSGQLSRDYIKLIQSFGDSLEALEVQSEQLRLVVNREWLFESKLRHAARIEMLSGIATRKFKNNEINSNYKRIFRLIQKNNELFKRCDTNEENLTRVLELINSLKRQRDGLQAAFFLMLFLTSIRRDNDLNYITHQWLNEWLSESGKTREEAIFWKTSVLYTVGERDGAIKRLREYIVTGEYDQLSWQLKFNLTYYLIESVLQAVVDEKDLANIRNECDRLILELDLKNASNDHSNYGAIQDTLGAYKIAFGASENEVEDGIALCRNAYDRASTDAAGVAFQRLHERIGWLKLLKSDFLEGS